MPELHSESDGIHGSGGEIHREPNRMGELPGEKLAVICNASALVFLYGVDVRLYCTEKKRHRGDHYDKVFSYGWQRMRK